MRPDRGVVGGRRGVEWDEQDYAELVALVATGADVLGMGLALGRSVPAVQAAVIRLTPVEMALRWPAAYEWLRERLAEGGYRWLEVARRQHAALGGHLWTSEDDLTVEAAWEAGTPLAVVAAGLGVGEQLVVRRLVRLGLAAGTWDVVERLGCAPGGVVDIRYRLAQASGQVMVYAAVVDRRGHQYVSLHSSWEAAVAAARDVPGWPESAGLAASCVVGAGRSKLEPVEPVDDVAD